MNKDGEQSCEEAMAYAKFMSKPEIIRMHLDILYKSISFLSKDKIMTILNDYKLQKAQKLKEEEERQHINQLRKIRGRNSSKKVTKDSDCALGDYNGLPDENQRQIEVSAFEVPHDEKPFNHNLI
jgi:hypothetical protein